jgi:hypothetical protein
MIHRRWSILLTLFALAAHAGEELALVPRGREALARHFSGYGWSLAEARAGRGFAWMQKLEADLAFDWPRAEALRLTLDAAPFFQTGRRQVVGVFLNGTYVGEQVFAADPERREFHFDLPATAVRAGANTLTFRLSYIARGAGGDRRKLGLQVHRVHLAALPPSS